MMKTNCTRLFRFLTVGCVSLCLALPALAKKSPEPNLNDQGEQIRQQYAQMLATLSKEIATKLPELDAEKRKAFLHARSEKDALKEPAKDAGPDLHKTYQASKAAAEVRVLKTARALLSDIVPLLTDGKLDAKLMKVAILRHGTPAGLAEFAQQSDKHKALIDDLLADESLMKQVLIAGGANGGE